MSAYDLTGTAKAAAKSEQEQRIARLEREVKTLWERLAKVEELQSLAHAKQVKL